MGAQTGQSYGAASQAQGMNQQNTQTNNPYALSFGAPVNMPMNVGMQNNMNQNSLDQVAQYQQMLGGGALGQPIQQTGTFAPQSVGPTTKPLAMPPGGSFYNPGAAQTQTDTLNNFMNQQRALGLGPSGSFYNNPMQQPMPQNTMQRQTNPFANFLGNRNILNQFRNPFIR